MEVFFLKAFSYVPLQALDSSIAGEEKTLQHVESMADMVRSNTSPAGAEAVVEEAEELRLGWQRLRQGLCEAEDGLRSSLDSHAQYVSRCQRLGEDISRLRALMQKLDRELEDSREAGEHTHPNEEQRVEQWRKYTVGMQREQLLMSALLLTCLGVNPNSYTLTW